MSFGAEVHTKVYFFNKNPTASGFRQDLDYRHKLDSIIPVLWN